MKSKGTFCSFFVLLGVLSVSVSSMDQASADNLGSYFLNRLGSTKGICALPKCGDGKLTLAIAQKSDMIIHTTNTDNANVHATRNYVESSGLVGRRIFIETGKTNQLPYNDNYLDLLIITNLTDSDLAGIALNEIIRSIHPNGIALVGRASVEGSGLSTTALQNWLNNTPNTTVESNAQGTWAVITKDKPATMDEWTHRLHGPDNNPVSNDRVLSFPFITQYRIKPYHTQRAGIVISAGGRLYTAFRHNINRMQILLRTYNVYNGQQLWTRELHKDDPDFPITHSFLVASGNHLYMASKGSVVQIDGKTGNEIRSIEFDNSKAIKWLAMSGSMLCALLGDSTKEDPISKFTRHRPLKGTVMRGYNLSNNSFAWTHPESYQIDGREIGISDGKIYYYASGSGLVCRDVQTGALQWEKRDISIVNALDAHKTPAWTVADLSGFVCSPKGLFISNPEDTVTSAFSVINGNLLWQSPNNRWPKTRHKALLGDVLFSRSGEPVLNIQNNTPATQYSNPRFGSGCGPIAMTSDLLFGCGGGVCYNVEQKKGMVPKKFKGPCDAPTVITNGLAIIPVAPCKCNPLHRGTIAKASLTSFSPDQNADENEYLEKGSAYGNVQRILVPETNDWPTHRANNHHTGSVQTSIATSSQPSKLWSYSPSFPYDTLYEDIDHDERPEQEPTPPVIVRNHVFWGGSDGYIRCYDGRQSKEVWKYATGSRIYATPTVSNGCIYVGSGDGYVYCLEAHSGKLVWRFRTAPIDRKINLYGTLTSAWPVLTGVLVHDGIAYFGAGLEDHGTRVFALDAATGAIKWQNNTSGKAYSQTDRVGFVPSGYMTIVGNTLWIKSHFGRNGIFDLASGAFKPLTGFETDNKFGPSLRGREIGVVNETYVLSGGRMTFSDPKERGGYARGITFSLCKIDNQNLPQYPVYEPFYRLGVTPAWDNEIMITATEENKWLERWDIAKLGATVDSVMDKNDNKLEVSTKNPWGEPPSTPMSVWRRDTMDINALALTSNAVLVAYSDRLRFVKRNDWKWFLAALDRNTGHPLWEEIELPGEPLQQGIAIGRNGQLVIMMRSGAVMCYGTDLVSIHSNRSLNNLEQFAGGTLLTSSAALGVREGIKAQTNNIEAVGPSKKPKCGIIREYWSGIWGDAVADLLGATYYPANPTNIDTLDNFAGVQNWADNYGQRLHGFIVPPVTGSYTFWIAADEQAQLYLSSDEKPENRKQIAKVTSAVQPLEWDKQPHQRSASIALTAGKRYYVEVLHKEGIGNDHCSVAWKIPGEKRSIIEKRYTMSE